MLLYCSKTRATFGAVSDGFSTSNLRKSQKTSELAGWKLKIHLFRFLYFGLLCCFLQPTFSGQIFFRLLRRSMSESLANLREVTTLTVVWFSDEYLMYHFYLNEFLYFAYIAVEI